ncbi:MAG: helix-turn-helix transcriptional regulator [Oscillospiraceae bacterium]|nr:helix-turn-helix transcriptional regulator [Oscillospiraceae bacterium]
MHNLKKLRLKKGYTQAMLAEFAGVGAGVAARWELGQTLPSLCQISKLCRALSCSPAGLFLTEDDCRCSGMGEVAVPVFSDGGAAAYTISVSEEEKVPHFGIVMPYSVSERINKGDICFFVMADSADDGDVVIAADVNGEETITQYSTDMPHRVVAVCVGLRCSI